MANDDGSSLVTGANHNEITNNALESIRAFIRDFLTPVMITITDHGIADKAKEKGVSPEEWVGNVNRAHLRAMWKGVEAEIAVFKIRVCHDTNFALITWASRSVDPTTQAFLKGIFELGKAKAGAEMLYGQAPRSVAERKLGRFIRRLERAAEFEDEIHETDSEQE
jgi:hypothetical protein